MSQISTVTSSTRPVSAKIGDIQYETDTNNLIVYYDPNVNTGTTVLAEDDNWIKYISGDPITAEPRFLKIYSIPEETFQSTKSTLKTGNLIFNQTLKKQELQIMDISGLQIQRWRFETKHLEKRTAFHTNNPVHVPTPSRSKVDGSQLNQLDGYFTPTTQSNFTLDYILHDPVSGTGSPPLLAPLSGSDVFMGQRSENILIFNNSFNTVQLHKHPSFRFESYDLYTANSSADITFYNQGLDQFLGTTSYVDGDIISLSGGTNGLTPSLSVLGIYSDAFCKSIVGKKVGDNNWYDNPNSISYNLTANTVSGMSIAYSAFSDILINQEGSFTVWFKVNPEQVQNNPALSYPSLVRRVFGYVTSNAVNVVSGAGGMYLQVFGTYGNHDGTEGEILPDTWYNVTITRDNSVDYNLNIYLDGVLWHGPEASFGSTMYNRHMGNQAANYIRDPLNGHIFSHATFATELTGPDLTKACTETDIESLNPVMWMFPSRLQPVSTILTGVWNAQTMALNVAIPYITSSDPGHLFSNGLQYYPYNTVDLQKDDVLIPLYSSNTPNV